MKYYYLLNGKIMSANGSMPEDTDDNSDVMYHYDYKQWHNSLQPCDISESELEKVVKHLNAHFGVVYSGKSNNNPIEVTDIISDNNGFITFKEKEQRYIVDIRSGCGAVIDTHHKDYDKDYPGLHQDTGGVVEYKHGFRSADRWDMKKEDIEYLNNLYNTLNNEPKQVEEIEAVDSEQIIKWIAQRIKDEQRKHEQFQDRWHEIAARKIYKSFNITQRNI